jgi:hypothetical protein
MSHSARARRLRPALVALGLLVLLTGGPGCGAEGTEAPPTAAPQQRCPTLDDRLADFSAALESESMADLGLVFDRLARELNGARFESALELLLEVLQVLPREEATRFQFDLIGGLIDDTEETLLATLRYLSTGPDSRRDLFPVLRQAVMDCPRDSLVLTVADFFKATDLLASVGATLEDPTLLSILASPPDTPTAGRPGFVALVRAAVNAIQSPNFNIAQLRDLLSFTDLDRPPLSDLMIALESYLQGERFDHLLLTLSCLEESSVDGISGIDVLAGLVYDLVLLEEIELGSLLSLAAPVIEQIQDRDLQTLGTAILNAMVTDLPMRQLAKDLVAFLIREDNVGPLLRALVTLIERDAIDDLVAVAEGLTVRCTQPPLDGE